MSISSSGSLCVPSHTQESLLTSRVLRDGRRWVDGFPELADVALARFEVRYDHVLGGQRSVCLIGVQASGLPVVLKLTPYLDELIEEATVLTHWAASGVVPRVVDTDWNLGAVLLEQVLPGTPLGSPGAPGDGVSPASVGQTLAALHSCGSAPVENYAAALEHRYDQMLIRLSADPAWVTFGPLVEWVYASALKLHNEALAVEQTVIHGDFQPKNLLAGPDGSVFAIDPLAGLGDPCFDAALWAVTDLAAPPIERALEELAPSAGLPLQRCLDWALLLGVFEHRPARRLQLATRIENFVDMFAEQISDGAAARAWVQRPFRHL